MKEDNMAWVQYKGRKMDIEEFEKQVQPRAKRSKLEPFQAQIFELKTKGYANWQVCEWLAANGVKVSQEGLRKFIKSRESNAPASISSAHPAPASAAPKSDEESPDNGLHNTKVQPNDLAGLDPKQRRERLADQFIKSENTNPLLKRLKEKNK
jgi:hypothetical protein